MNVAKWLLLTLLALPFMELAVFIAVAGSIGFLWALRLLLATSLGGAMVLRHAGGNHIARVRVAMGEGSFTALQADSAGGRHPAGWDSPANSRVYNGYAWASCCCWRRCAGRSPRCLECGPRPRARTAWSISSPSSGTRFPTAALPDRPDNKRESP